MFQKPGNIVLEQAPHPLSQIFTLTGNLQQCSVLTSGAVQLNTGVWFYDTWQISMLCERATAHCFLSFGKDCLDNWVHVIGEDAAATADLRRNVLRITEKTRFMEPVDNYLVTRRGGRDMLAQGFANLKDYSAGFLGLKPPADPFTAGMRGSIQAFHDAWRRGASLPVSLADATEVIRACERIPIEAGVGVAVDQGVEQKEYA
jgi:predicted dehydrogenase